MSARPDRAGEPSPGTDVSEVVRCGAMARMPDVEWVGEHGRHPMVCYDVICVHTMAGGRAPAHAAHFSTGGDGTIFQSRDTSFQSAANTDGPNRRIIAIENEDTGPDFPEWNRKDGHAVPDFTDAQVESIAQICAWVSATHGIPLELCPDSRRSSRGIAYHRQGCDGNFGPFAFSGRVDDGEHWSAHFGKVCPGDRRITTLLERIIPRAIEIAGGVPAARPTAIAEAADMLVGQDSKTGKLWLVSGNTKLRLPEGGGTLAGDEHSAGNTGHVFVDEVLRMIEEAYPGSDPKFIALNHEILEHLPEIGELVDND